MAAGLCAAGIALGNWQAGRAAQTQWIADRLATYDSAPATLLDARPVPAEDYAWRKVEARGEFDAGRTLFLGNRAYRGRPGLLVVTPLRIDGSQRYLLVLRGWLPWSGNAPTAPDVPTGRRVVKGLAVPHVARVYEPGPPGHERVRQNIDLAEFERESGLSLYPFFLEQRDAAEDGLVRDWPAHDALLEKHRIYAGQWFALAALSLIIFLVLSFRHGRRPDAA